MSADVSRGERSRHRVGTLFDVRAGIDAVGGTGSLARQQERHEGCLGTPPRTCRDAATPGGEEPVAPVGSGVLFEPEHTARRAKSGERQTDGRGLVDGEKVTPYRAPAAWIRRH